MSPDQRDIVVVEQLILKVVRALVDNEDAVRLEVTPTATGSCFRIHLATGDAGKVIGKQGRTARSLRTILGAIAVKYQHSITLDIVHSGISETS